MSSFFGGKKSSSDSGNYAYNDIKSAYSPVMGQAATGATALSKLLGGDSSGFNAFKQATGFDALTEQGSRGITGNAAASGLLRSGGTGKSLADYYGTMQNQFANSYMDKLLGQAGLGMQAGGLISNAGQFSKQRSSDKPGLGDYLLGGAKVAAMSDRRSKTNIKALYKLNNGLTVYEFSYKAAPNQKEIGVMADEVAKHQPEALGPVRMGFQTVDYSKIDLKDAA